MLISIFLGFVSILCYLHFWVYSRRPKNFPPGPSLMLPLFGNALQLGAKSYETAFALKEKYGDIIGFRVGAYWTVVLNSPQHIQEAFSKVEFSNRMGFNFLMTANVRDANRGIAFSNGPTWMHNRQLVQKSLRRSAFAYQTVEAIIMNEVKSLQGRLRAMEDQEINTEDLFSAHILNITWCVVSGKRYEHDDPKFLELINLFEGYWQTLAKGIGPLFYIFPQLVTIHKRFPFLFSEQGNLFRQKLFVFFKQAIKEHRDTFQAGQPRDVLDALLEDAMKTKSADEMNILATLLDIFFGGMETCSTTLRWACYLLAMYPRVQEKLVDEIRANVGTAEVALSDRSRLLYTEATINEIHRVGCSGTTGPFHSTATDVLLDGFRIPKDTLIVPNYYACMHSKEIWGDPENFRPERFISPEGKSILRNDGLTPFGSGRRSCPGEVFARDELFLFLTNLVQNFQICFPPHEHHGAPLNVFVAGFRRPGAHSIVVHSRN